MSLVFVFVNVFHRANNIQLHFLSLRLSLTRLSHIHARACVRAHTQLLPSVQASSRKVGIS